MITLLVLSPRDSLSPSHKEKLARRRISREALLREESCELCQFLPFFFYTRIVKSRFFFAMYFEIRPHESSRKYYFDRKLTHFPLFALFLFRRFSDRTIVISTTREINHLSSSVLLLSPDHSLAPHVLLPLSLAHTPSLTSKHAYKHALAHADTQKCPTNTHSRNFSELRYLDKNITAV